MVERTLLAIDSEALTVAAGSPFLTPGSSIINNSSTPDGTIFDFTGGLGQIITLDDTNNVDTFDDDDPNNHEITDGGTLVANGTNVESESLIELRELDEFGNPVGDVITINVYSQNGQTSNIWGFSATDQLNPGKQYVKVGGSNNGDSDYVDIAPCFTRGTLILTDRGQVAVEDIAPGDLVWTLDNGFQPVGWAGCTTVAGRGDFAPVRFEAGVLGNARPITVSPNHRMLYQSSLTELHFFEDRVLIPARFFVGMAGVQQRPVARIDYFHFMFAGHEIVQSDGCLSESFYPGSVALNGLQDATRRELFALFPELAGWKAEPFDMAARSLRRFEAQMVLDTAA